MEQRENRETSTHINAILEQTPNGVLLVDKDTCIQYVNPAFRKLLIARLLGETTAETKVLLVKLMSLFEEGSQ
jgi:PAS domain-containing protein